MESKRSRWMAVAVVTGMALAIAGCGGSSGDRAGGTVAGKPRVLTMASQSAVPLQLSRFAQKVSELSDGTLEVDFKEQWRLGEPDYEAGTIDDVKSGRIDLAWVGARAFDTIGMKSFQALVAPFLVDSHDLEAKVFEQGIPEQMLEGVNQLDLVGIGVLPGPMRKVLGVSHPFVRPKDFAGEVVGIQDSTVAQRTMEALGATPRPVPAEASLEGLDAYEQQLESIAGNRYDSSAKYVTANVNLWPRPLVIIMGDEASESLTDGELSLLRDAAAAVIPEALDESRAEDDTAADALCKRGGMTFIVASDGDLAELHAAVEPVYAELEADPATKSYIEAITSLKTEIGASGEAPDCTESTEKSETGQKTPVDGVYRASFTRDDLKRSPELVDAGEINEENWGDFTLTLHKGRVTFEQHNEIASSSTSGTFEIDGDSIILEFTEGGNAGETFAFRWSLYKDTLTFKRDESLGVGPTPYLVESWHRDS
jgi:TRAP-type C4-dicarboxylate transport system substrate-binding protein